MTILEIAKLVICPLCDAQIGDSCVPYINGVHGERIDTYYKWFQENIGFCDGIINDVP